jgi:hypothetical protein
VIYGVVILLALLVLREHLPGWFRSPRLGKQR